MGTCLNDEGFPLKNRKVTPLDVDTATFAGTARAPCRSMSMPIMPPDCLLNSCILYFCCCCLAVVFGMPFFIFLVIAALVYGPYLPKYDIQNFHIAGLAPAVQSSATENSTLIVNVGFEILSRNPNSKASFDYDTLDVQVQANDLTLGNRILPGFRQGHDTTAIPVALKTPVQASDYAVSIMNGLDLSNLLLVIKVDTNGHYKLKFPLVWHPEPSTFWMDIRCWAVINATESNGAPAIVKKRDCRRRTELD